MDRTDMSADSPMATSPAELHPIQAITPADNKIILAQRTTAMHAWLHAVDSLPFVANAQTQEVPEALSPHAGIIDGAVFIHEHKKPVNYGKIWPTNIPVLFAGERHVSLSDKQEIIDHLRELKAQGLTHIGMEMLLERDQQLVNDYLAGKEPREKIRKLFDSWDRGNGQPEKLMEMVDAAKAAKLKVLALDLNDDPNNEPPHMFQKRNENWARIIDATLKSDRHARVLVYCGVDHSTYRGEEDNYPPEWQRYFSTSGGEKTANEILLDRYKHQSVVVSFAGAIKNAGFDKRHEDLYWHYFWNVLSMSSMLARTDGERFSIAIKPVKPRQEDYIIHLPQTELVPAWF